MIELYGMSSPNVFKVSIMLEEIGLPWRCHYVNVVKGEQYAPAFLAKSPNNKVPMIVDPEGANGQPIPVFESGAILIYLAEKSGQLLSKEPAERTVQLQWLMMQTSTVGPMFGQFVHFTRYAPQDDGLGYARDRYHSELRRILGVLERRLSTSPYFGGEAYSIADIAFFPWVRVLGNMFPPFAGKPKDEAFADYPGLARWFVAVRARPAVASGLRKLEADVMAKDKTAFGDAELHDIDRFVGRGKFHLA